MKALRDRLCLYYRAITKREGQDQATYTDFQKEFGLDKAVESVSKQAKRRQYSQQAQYGLPIGIVLVGLVAAFLAKDEADTRDMLLRSNILKWEIASSIASAGSLRKRLLDAYFKYYNETPKQSPKILLKGILNCVEVDALREEEAIKLELIMQKILPLVERHPSEATLGIATQLLQAKIRNMDKPHWSFSRRLAQMCLTHGNLHAQYLAAVSEPTLTINSKALKKYQENLGEIDKPIFYTADILHFRDSLKVRQAQYLYNRIVAAPPTTPLKISAQVKTNLSQATDIHLLLKSPPAC